MQGVFLLFLCAIALIDAQPKTSTFSTLAVEGGLQLGVRNNDCLWPPNHKYVYFHDVAKSNNYVRVEKGCNFPVEKKVLGCISDQDDNGLGDGNTVRDCVYVPKFDAVCVRSERQGMKPEGRTYHVIFELTSKCFAGGKPISARWPIHVPHDAAGTWDTKTCWDPNHPPSKAISCDPDLAPPTTEPRCQPGKCDDGNDCTEDYCNEATGQCTHTSVGCDDNDPCTVDTCVKDGGVSSSSVTQATGNPNCVSLALGAEAKYEPVKSGNGQLLFVSDSVTVTIDVSSDKQKASYEVTGASVSAVIVKAGTDSLVYKYGSPTNADQAVHGPARPQGGFYEISHISFCWGVEAPKVGGCKHEPRVCSDNNLCTKDTCDSKVAGGCVFTAIPAPREAGKCEVASCDAATGWQFKDANVQCNDNNACTVDTCDNAVGCKFTQRTDKPAVTKCQTVSCDSQKGWVIVDKVCQDNDVCTEDSCDAATGECVFKPKVCDDGLFCTVDTCVPATGCNFVPRLPPTPSTDKCFSTVCDENKDAFVDVASGMCSPPVLCDYRAGVECFSSRTQTLQSRAGAFETILNSVAGSKYVPSSLHWATSLTGNDYANVYYFALSAALTETETAQIVSQGKSFFFLTTEPQLNVEPSTTGTGLVAIFELYPVPSGFKRAFAEESTVPVVGIAVGAVALVAFVVVAAYFVKRN